MRKKKKIILNPDGENAIEQSATSSRLMPAGRVTSALADNPTQLELADKVIGKEIILNPDGKYEVPA